MNFFFSMRTSPGMVCSHSIPRKMVSYHAELENRMTMGCSCQWWYICLCWAADPGFHRCWNIWLADSYFRTRPYIWLSIKWTALNKDGEHSDGFCITMKRWQGVHLRCMPSIWVSLTSFYWIQWILTLFQKWYGYQRCTISYNRYIPWCGSIKEIFITISGLVSVQCGEWQQISD